MKKNKNFNLIINGVGGQGQLTVLKILNEACFIENYDLKSSELHGLSQRGGPVEVHLRFGENIFSPLVSQAGADLILSLEMQEVLRALYYAGPKTKILINKKIIPIAGEKLISEKEILNQVKSFTKNIQIIEASKICREELGNEVLAGVYLLSFCTSKNLIPLEPNSILSAIEKIIPEKYLELNKKTFQLARRYEKK
jgi:indolepyruvate ferredoxin oxidoreductase beta subunit